MVLVVRPPVEFGAAAGSMYTSVPVIMMAEHATGGRQSFAGCYVLRRPNVPEESPLWRIYDATVRQVPDSSPSATLLAGACPAQ